MNIWAHFANLDFSWLAQFFSLLILPFAHEDGAIVLGAYIVVNDLMPMWIVAAIVFAGMIASDFALYAIGAGARHLPWLDRWAVDDRVRGIADLVKRNLFGLVALCRVVPGVVFVAFIACGWSRVPLRRFALASVGVSAVYLTVMLYLAIVFGDALDDHAGLWTWPALWIAMILAGYARKRVFSFGEAASAKDAATTVEIGPGVPALGGPARRVALAERIPPALFYAPLVLTWLGFAWRHRSLTLPASANPLVPGGGMWGESKSDYFLDVAPAQRQWIADFVVLTRDPRSQRLYADLDRAMQMLGAQGITFPIVAKPDIGHHGYGVRRVDDVAALRDYLRSFPRGEKVILQRFVPHAGEAGVLYARLPGEKSGRILSLTLRYFAHVVGDGRSTVRELIRKDQRAHWKARFYLGQDRTHQPLTPHELQRIPRQDEVVRIAMICSQRAGGLHRDGRHFITPELEARIDAIAQSMTEFHYGRFDLRFESTAELSRGDKFAIVEISGIGGEAIDAWDPGLPLAEAYRRLIDQQRILFLIGERNRERGFKPLRLADFLKPLIRQATLVRRYPASA